MSEYNFDENTLRDENVIRHILERLPDDVKQSILSELGTKPKAVEATYIKFSSKDIPPVQQDIAGRIEALEKVVKESKLSELPKVIELLNKLASCSLLNTEETIVAQVSPEEAVSRIKEYIRTHPKCTTSDIIDDLAIDPDIVIEALSRLEQSDEVEGKVVE
ncbi:MAG: hypothetical protein M1503_09540 [Thaumarchaeota archaeon]|nr:hypothetical protein [Nitrososphaerota archaeon]MCL5318481.1 hypothetical protein [Nitrososphaerota archaeon]